MRKRIMAIMLSICFVTLNPFTYLVENTEVSAAQSENQILEENLEFPTGLLPTEDIVIQVEEEPQYMTNEDGIICEDMIYESQVYDSEWDKCKNYYYYNQMTDAEKAYWDALDAVAMKYLTTEMDATVGTGNYYTQGVRSEDLSWDEMKKVFDIFRFSNPQYYFFKNSQIKLVISKTVNGVTTKTYLLAFSVYPGFADGKVRAEETAKVKAQLEEWADLIDTYNTESEKVKYIHDLIVNKVEYNHEYVAIQDSDEKNEAENTAYTQSAYSVFCMDKTVCVGYAQAFEMLCNYAGVDAVAVTSYNHEWNKVRINDSWYNVDCTWADQANGINYKYFERSDNVYDTSENVADHTEEECWEEYLPLCTLDSAPDSPYSVPGTVPTINETTETPVITVDEKSGSMEIVSATSGAKVYYTIDGTEPVPSAAKSNLYRSEIQLGVDESVCVKAVAVCDTMWDSAVVSEDVKWNGPGSGESDTSGGSGNGNGESDTSGGSGIGNGESGTTHTPESEAVKTEVPQENTILTNVDNQADYKITKSGSAGGTVEYRKPSSKSAKTITIPSTITVDNITYKVSSIAKNAFKNNKKITKVIIGDNITTIGANAFSGCTALKTITMGKKVITLGDKAFYKCTALTKITIPSKVSKIGKQAFYGCKKLKDITVKTTKLTSKNVGSKAFKGTPKNVKVKVPKSKLKAYKKLLVSKGINKKAKIKK